MSGREGLTPRGWGRPEDYLSPLWRQQVRLFRGRRAPVNVQRSDDD